VADIILRIIGQDCGETRTIRLDEDKALFGGMKKERVEPLLNHLEIAQRLTIHHTFLRSTRIS
jgi:hypothetical protein